MMKDELLNALECAKAQIRASRSSAELKEVRVKFLGKKGVITQALRSLGQVPPDERPAMGRLANDIRESIESLVESRENEIKKAETEARLKREAVDITLPGAVPEVGRKHLITRTFEEIERVFSNMGYQLAEGPEIETDWYNFVALNMPKDHPARDMQASFYVTEDILLRTHTSPVQIRTMQRMAPNLPIRIIAPGRVYRRDDDATHSPMFHQVEGLVVDRGITFGDLKGALLAFAREFFGEETEIRLRPSYFPFTEPSAEVDISCTMCRGCGCRVCKGTGWLEILGSGMVHPEVLRHGGYDPEEVSGFAFGMGVERIAMLKYGVDDLRLFFQNDKRFLEQF